MGNVLGIDFGTSNTTLAFWSEQKNAPEVLRAKNGLEKIPSFVYLEKPWTFGHAALQTLVDAQHVEDEQKRQEIYCLIVPKVKMELIDNTSFFTSDGEDVSACDITSEFLKYLKQYAEDAQFHSPIEEVHISHPVIDPNAFTVTARDRLKEAALKAGFTRVELIEEPVAAAYGYIAQGVNVGDNVLVYDIGAGTLDLAYLSRDCNDVYHPEKTRSVPNCAGSNFDQLIYKHIASRIEDLEYDENALFIDVLMECQKCKETLSDNKISYWHGRSYSVTLTRSEFENMIRDRIHESLRAAEEIFDELQNEGKSIDTFLLIGGSSRIPLIINEFKRLYEEKRISCKPIETQMRDVAVALGTVCGPQKIKEIQEQEEKRKQEEEKKKLEEERKKQEEEKKKLETKKNEWIVKPAETRKIYEDW